MHMSMSDIEEAVREEKETVHFTAETSMNLRITPRPYTPDYSPKDFKNIAKKKSKIARYGSLKITSPIPNVYDVSDFEPTSEAHGISRDSLNNFQVVIHLLKGSVGTGILTMPSAVRNAGLWFGSVGIFLLGFVVVHCMQLLVVCAQHVRAHHLKEDGNSANCTPLDYQTVVEKCFEYGPSQLKSFKNVARIGLQVFLVITQVGLGCIYLLFVAENISYFVNHFYPSYTPPLVQYNALVALLLLPLVFIKRMDRLAILMSIANVCMVVSLAFILVYCLTDLPASKQYPAVASANTIPLWFGMVLFSFESINLLMPVENKMRDKKSLPGFTGVLNFAMTIVLVMYTAVGFYGYLKFGEHVDGALTYYMPNEPWYFLSIKPLYAVAIHFSYVLQNYVLVEVLWSFLSSKVPKNCSPRVMEYLLRILLVLLSFALASFVPKLELLISLLGAWSGSAIILMYPAIIHSVLFWNERRKFCCFSLILLKNVVIFILGIAGLVLGTITTVQALHNSFTETDNVTMT